jgi:hypothetical protein
MISSTMKPKQDGDTLLILVWYVLGALLAFMVVGTVGHLILHDWNEAAWFAGAAVLICLTVLWMRAKTPR